MWDLAHDVVTTVALPGEVALDEVGGRVLHVAGSQMTLRSLDGEALTGPVETRVHPGPGPDQHIHVGLAGRRTRWVLLNDHTLEVRDATTLELVVRHEAQRDSVQLDAHPDADAFVVRTAHRVELFDARTGRRRARLTAPSRQLLPDAVVFGAGGQQVLVVWSAFFENEDEEMWWEHQLTLHDVATGRALAHTDQSYGSASGPLVFGRSARYASEEAWMRWEPGHAPAPEPHPAAQPGVTVSRDPAVNEDEVHPVVDRDGEVVAWIVERDRDRLELIAGDHRSNVDLWYSGGEVRVSDSPFANGVEWDRGTVTALSAHGATHFHQHRPNIRWTPEGRAIACPVREPPAECGVGRERAAVLRGPGGVGERSSGRVLTLRRAGHALTVQTGSAADGTRACLVVTDESGTVSDCEPGQVLARGPGHVLDAPLTNSARRGAASALVTFFTRDPGLAP